MSKHIQKAIARLLLLCMLFTTSFSHGLADTAPDLHAICDEGSECTESKPNLSLSGPGGSSHASCGEDGSCPDHGGGSGGEPDPNGESDTGGEFDFTGGFEFVSGSSINAVFGENPGFGFDEVFGDGMGTGPEAAFGFDDDFDLGDDFDDGFADDNDFDEDDDEDDFTEDDEFDEDDELDGDDESEPADDLLGMFPLGWGMPEMPGLGEGGEFMGIMPMSWQHGGEEDDEFGSAGPHEHNWVLEATVAPTCASPGWLRYRCDKVAGCPEKKFVENAPQITNRHTGKITQLNTGQAGALARRAEYLASGKCGWVRWEPKENNGNSYYCDLCGVPTDKDGGAPQDGALKQDPQGGVDHLGPYAVHEAQEAATCMKAGKGTSICLNCNQLIPGSVLPLNPNAHDWGAWDMTTEATCVSQGVEARYCNLNHAHTETRDVAVDPNAHVWGAPVIESEATTCEHDPSGVGYRTVECTLCPEIKTREPFYLPHVYIPDVTLPTCVDDGFTTYTCSLCEDAYTDDEVEATGHAWGEWVQTRPSACEVEGEEKRECAACDAYETREIEALGHTAGEEATCLEDQTCIRCDYVFVEALGHTAGEEATCLEDQTCIRCDYVFVEALGHTAGEEATCLEDQTCIRCEHVFKGALGHTAGEEAT